MPIPIGCIRITLSKQVSDATTEARCLGAHLVKLIKLIQPRLPICNWYAADVSAYNLPIEFSSDHIPVLIGNTEVFVKTVGLVEQFLSGIFWAVPSSIKCPKFREDIETLSDPFLDLGSAVVEIRAFDTSYFEIYSADERVLQCLSELFADKIVRPL